MLLIECFHISHLHAVRRGVLMSADRALGAVRLCVGSTLKCGAEVTASHSPFASGLSGQALVTKVYHFQRPSTASLETHISQSQAKIDVEMGASSQPKALLSRYKVPSTSVR